MIDRIVSNIVVTSCPVLQSVDLTDVRDLVTCLFGDGEETTPLRPFVMVAVRENVHFRLPLKRIYDGVSKLLDIISATYPGKEKFARVRGEEDCGHTWYLPLVKIDSRRGKTVLTEAKEELPERFR